jgi:hypothetical protein
LPSETPAFPDGHDWSGAVERTYHLPNCVVRVEVLGQGEAIRVHLHNRATFDLAAADLAPLVTGGDAQHALIEAIYRETLARQRIPVSTR